MYINLSKGNKQQTDNENDVNKHKISVNEQKHPQTFRI